MCDYFALNDFIVWTELVRAMARLGHFIEPGVPHYVTHHAKGRQTTFFPMQIIGPIANH